MSQASVVGLWYPSPVQVAGEQALALLVDSVDSTAIGLEEPSVLEHPEACVYMLTGTRDPPVVNDFGWGMGAEVAKELQQPLVGLRHPFWQPTERHNELFDRESFILSVLIGKADSKSKTEEGLSYEVDSESDLYYRPVRDSLGTVADHVRAASYVGLGSIGGVAHLTKSRPMLGPSACGGSRKQGSETMRQEANDAENSIGGLPELSGDLRKVRADGGTTTATPPRNDTDEPASSPKTVEEHRARLAAELGIEGYDPARTRDPPPYRARTRRDIAVALTDLEMERACLIPAYEVTQYVRDELLEDGNDGYGCWSREELEQLLEIAAEQGGEGT